MCILHKGLVLQDWVFRLGLSCNFVPRLILCVSFTVFDSCLKGKPFKFRLGAGEVIKGWDVGVEGMKVGGKRRLTIPPQMAYGAKGAPPDIPANSHLVFEVECKAVN